MPPQVRTRSSLPAPHQTDWARMLLRVAAVSLLLLTCLAQAAKQPKKKQVADGKSAGKTSGTSLLEKLVLTLRRRRLRKIEKGSRLPTHILSF